MKDKGENTLPADVYLSFVSSLYGNRQTLLVGMISHVITFSFVYAKTSDPFYLVWSALVVLIWALRAEGMRHFDRADKDGLDMAGIRYWENWYNLGAVGTTLALGTACCYSLIVARDAFAEIACISVTFATMVSVVGRNYGSPRAVSYMVFCACFPIAVGFLALQDFYHAVLASLVLPFAMTTRSMANGVRTFLYENVLAARELATIADRFDTALNNMPHGLFMLDADHRILVANRRACELLHLGSQERLKDCHLDVVLRFGVRNTFFNAEQSRTILRQLDELLRGERSRALVQVTDGLYLEFTAAPRDNGGAVLIFEDVTARVRAEKKILHMVRYDSLTGLPNRTYFADLVQEALAERKKPGTVGFMVLDVDDFKHVNDMKGHVTGDRLLCAIAERLRRLTGDRVLAGHLMGDEFILFFPNEANRRDLEARMRRFHEQLRGTYEFEGTTLFVSFSAGCVTVASDDFRLEEMQIRADLALFETKSRAKGSVTIFEQEMDARYMDRQKLKEDLREALANDALSVAYQPMFVPDGSSIECCEALSRWTHPERGPVAPNVFIQIAEEIGIVSEITRFMINRACADCATWPAHMGVSVNLSVQDLRGTAIIEIVSEALEAAGLAPRRLHLEVTESCLMEEPVKVQAILQELRARGITIAIDDFGTGYSSLSYLDQLPLDVIKIDRSFVRNIGEDPRRFKLLRGTVNLSRELGLRIVIEGVETEEQLALINKYHCADLVQGYVFAAPMSPDALRDRYESLGGKPVEPRRRGRRVA
ncbi:putative bifunctional diguanylate cyclase/phosphodiesterase [Shinella zoogloeoides]|jgi:diguanylate cyclase (GGDEF)-like protein|uniref:putative bifunctional diguanylate cyclase/phosphodiesterase n=1 Tax=Shinella zoogloeoides TaxID=352475 RepID=UPI00273FFD39|nr:EAL domain-containing protein [Shinella zoogloeoides]WLR91820.1 EAL domain-containing protein [Shinella zoogloeoides]